MYLRDLVEEVKKEINKENIEKAKEMIKERLVEVSLSEKILAKQRKQLEELLEKEIKDVVDLL